MTTTSSFKSTPVLIEASFGSLNDVAASTVLEAFGVKVLASEIPEP
jgi:hypothetical protein